jgi:hypothetical protein
MLKTSSWSNVDCGHNYVPRCFIAIGCPHVDVPFLRLQQSWYFYIISGIYSETESGISFPISPQESEFCAWKIDSLGFGTWVWNIKISRKQARLAINSVIVIIQNFKRCYCNLGKLRRSD